VKRGLWIALAALLAFAAIILVRLPASWVVPVSAKSPGACASVEGTLWSGSCNGLTVQHLHLGDLSWELHPQRLLAGRIAAHVTIAGTVVRGSADAEAGLTGHLLARNVRADLPLDPKFLPGLPAAVRGQAHLELALAEVEHGIVKHLVGRIEVHDLEERRGQVTRLGSYRLTFPAADGEPTGQLRDLDGPLSVDGTLRLTAQGGFDVEGTVAPKPGAPRELTDNLQFLGSPDASGRRQFSLSGTF
jgi:general secretion pathway protein N